MGAGIGKVRGRLLFVGDMHLGRNPVRVPPDWDDPRSLGPAAGWERAVELACAAEVAAVVLAGDVVESLEDRFEALRLLSDGLARLHAQGIPVWAVAGNHDVRALPRLARLESVRGFRILGWHDGQCGGWQSTVVEAAGVPLCRLVGWSFGSMREPRNPLPSLTGDLLGDDELPVLGVLHCDRGAGSSPYAPVDARDFERGAAARVAAWFLGHVHKPDHAGLAAARPVGYLGSLVGLDPGEPGRHGPWLVEVGERGVRATQHGLAPIRWESAVVAVDGLDQRDSAELQDELFRRISAELAALDQRLAGDGTPRAVGVRVTLDGAVAHPAALRDAWARLERRAGGFVRDLGPRSAPCRYFCERVRLAIRPRESLHELARQSSPIGSLARGLLRLQAGDDTLLARAAQHFDRVRPGVGWPDLADELTPGRAQELLVDAAYELIGELRAQERAAEAGR
ncbi:MAG: metallophosphoesterase [Planctomycetes bacterium]|nr:metallophosphoesterase [Planctomycetota bacterium]